MLNNIQKIERGRVKKMDLEQFANIIQAICLTLAALFVFVSSILFILFR